MGQPVGIVNRREVASNVVRYELDRTLTGTGHESYTSDTPVTGERPPDVLARRLFETGLVSRIHIFSNVVTITVTAAVSDTEEALASVMRDLYIHYLPGVRPTPV